MDRNYVIRKSNYFIMNSSYDLSLEEQKVILTLASMVRQSDEDFKPYNFKISEFMELLGIENKSKYSEIPKITKNLMKKVLEIQEGDTFIQTAWLSSAVYKKGSGQVELTFSPYLKPYMLKLNELYTSYRLSNVLSMKSKYSPRLYEVLKCNAFKQQGFIILEVEDLRKLLKVENIYPLYNDFKRKIIEKAQKELKQLTDLFFEFEEIKTGRKVTAIKFYIKSNNKNEEIAVTENLTTVQKESPPLTCPSKINSSGSQNLLLKSLICNTAGDDLKECDIETVMAIFKEAITPLEAKKLLDAANGDIELIKSKYKLSGTVSKINNIVAFMISAIKEDYKKPKSKVSNGSFNNYEQREYDFEELEKQLLGWK